MATSSHGTLHTRKGAGLVHEVFTQDLLDALRGSAGIGHNRYPTTGSSSDLENAQPIVFKLKDEEAALAANGDLVNFERVRHRLQAQGIDLLGNADTETMAQMIALEDPSGPGTSRQRSDALRRSSSAGTPWSCSPGTRSSPSATRSGCGRWSSARSMAGWP